MAALLAALALLAACSVERSLDGDDLASQVRAQLFPEYPDLVTAVDCPAVLEPLPGDEFACGAQFGSQIIDVPIVLSGTEDELSAQVVLDDRFVQAEQLSELLAATFTAEVGIVTAVDCGQPVVVLAAGESLVCTATDPEGVNRGFDVVVGDDGAVEISIR